MDSYDIFKKLSIGAKFNFKKYQNDAIKLQVKLFLIFFYIIYLYFLFNISDDKV